MNRVPYTYGYRSRRTDERVIFFTIVATIVFTLVLISVLIFEGLVGVIHQEQPVAEAEEIKVEVNVFLELPKDDMVQELPPVKPIKQVKQEVKELLGEFTITYYCNCEKCCGTWATNRPVVDGKEVVYTASGAIAEAGITIAVDTSKIPFGTKLYIEGVGYRVAQDRGGAINGNRIDVYMNSHEEALEAGRHSADVYIVTE